MHMPITHPPPAPYVPPPVAPPAQPARFPLPQLIYDPAAIFGALIHVFTAGLIYLTATIAGIVAVTAAVVWLPGILARLPARPRPWVTAAVIIIVFAGAYSLNADPAWRGYPSVTGMAAMVPIGLIVGSPCSPFLCVRRFWQGRLQPTARGRQGGS
jgi:hypothetical protein